MQYKRNIWMVYAVDREGDPVFIKQTRYSANTTEFPNHASKFYEVCDARNCIKWINNGFVDLEDEMVDPKNLKIAYTDEDGNVYDNGTDKVLFINKIVDEDMDLNNIDEAKKVLKRNGYRLIERQIDLSPDGVHHIKAKNRFASKDEIKEQVAAHDLSEYADISWVPLPPLSYIIAKIEYNDKIVYMTVDQYEGWISLKDEDHNHIGGFKWQPDVINKAMDYILTDIFEI